MAPSVAHQRGSMSIIVVGLFLPLLFFLFTLSLDVAAYYVDQSKVQAELDETAQYAFRFLPYVDNARSAALSYASRFSGLGGLTVEISDSTILLRVERRTNLTFAKLVGVTDASLPLSVVSRVRGSPFDSYIVLDTSSSAAPRFGQAAWGGETEWPAAQYFDDLGGISARSKTQRCFNPIFSALKLSAIDAYRYLGASSVNSVGLGFYTGSAQTSLINARAVTPLPHLPSTPPEVSFVGFADNYVGPSLCAAAAEMESNATHYKFPTATSAFPSRGDFTSRPSARIIPGSNQQLNPEYEPYLQGEDLIWSQATSDSSGMNFGSAFRSALGGILAGDRATGRGGLVARPARVLVWLAAGLPSEDGIAYGNPNDDSVKTAIHNAFNGMASGFGETGLTIYYVVMANENTGFTPSTGLLTALQNEFRTAASANEIPEGKLTVRVLGIRSAEDLTEALSRWIAISNKTTVVAL